MCLSHTFQHDKYKFNCNNRFTTNTTLFEVLHSQLKNCSENLDLCCSEAFDRLKQRFSPRFSVSPTRLAGSSFFATAPHGVKGKRRFGSEPPAGPVHVSDTPSHNR